MGRKILPVRVIYNNDAIQEKCFGKYSKTVIHVPRSPFFKQNTFVSDGKTWQQDLHLPTFQCNLVQRRWPQISEFSKCGLVRLTEELQKPGGETCPGLPHLLHVCSTPGAVPVTGGICVHVAEGALAFPEPPGRIFCELASALALVDSVAHFPDLSCSCFFFLPPSIVRFFARCHKIPDTKLSINNQRMFLVHRGPAFLALFDSNLRTMVLSPSLKSGIYLYLCLSTQPCMPYISQ